MIEMYNINEMKSALCRGNHCMTATRHNAITQKKSDKVSSKPVSINTNIPLLKHLGPVYQSVVSLTSSLRGQLVKCFTTL